MSGRLAVAFLSVFAAVTLGVFTLGGKAKGGTYEQVVDNSDKGRFAASGSWKTGDSGEGISGDDYRFALPSKKSAHALFKVEIPADGEYTIYARWPEVPGLNDRVPVGVQTAYGTRWTEVDQTRDGGLWVRVGEFEMRGGEEYPVRISRGTDGEGNVVADAVKVVRVDSYEETASEPASEETSVGVSAQRRAAGGTDGSPVVAEAKKYLGTRYKLGGPAACAPYKTMDCTCLTETVFAKFGYRLPDDEAGQTRFGEPVSKRPCAPATWSTSRRAAGA